jgi:serine/threonine-protein kinase
VRATLPETLAGAVLDDRYAVGNVLARGGMSTVYVGSDLRLDRPVAIKAMAPWLADDATFAATFEHEARLAARLSHPNIVAVFDQGVDRGQAFLVMELIRGRTLRELIREHGRLSPALAVTIIEQVLVALAAAHRAGLVHRDVKPGNILLGDDGAIKVADFGLAAAVAQLAVESGPVIGTASYIAPEQVSTGRADARSDVYSAGVVLYEMLTGAPPHRGPDSAAIAAAHVHHDVPPPSWAAPDVPEDLDALTVRATRREPAARPADAAAFLAELGRVCARLDGYPVPIPPRLHRPDRLARTMPHRLPPASQTTIGTADDAPARPLVGPASPAASDAPTRAAQSTARVDQAPTRRIDRAPTADSATVVERRRPTERLIEAATDIQRPSIGSTRQVGPSPVEPVGQPRRRWRFAVAVLVVILLAAGAAAAGWWYGGGRYTSVPKMNQLTVQQAQAVAATHHLRLQVLPSREHSEVVPADAVLRTTPSAGARVLRDQTITVELSSGPERYVVAADLIGQPQTTAAQALAPLPLTVHYAQDYSDTVKPGAVIRIDPAPGTALRRGQSVTVVVSDGPRPVPVPEVVGLAQDHAVSEITAARLAAEVRSANSDTVPVGRVISQDPADGDLRPGQTVTIVVSDGPQLISVPQVVGLSADDAERALTNAGFEVSRHVLLAGFAGTVVRTDPEAGSPRPRGSLVTITLL